MARPVDTGKIARRWRVSTATVRTWLDRGYPVENDEEMAHTVMSQKRPKPETVEIAREILEQGENGEQLALVTFDEAVNEASGVDLEGAQDYFWGQCLLALKRGDRATSDLNLKRFIDISKVRREEQYHRLKMGIDDGSVITREQLEAWIFAIAFWNLRGVDTDVRHMAAELKRRLELTKGDADLDPDNREELDRFFMRRRFLVPFTRSIQEQSGVSLPKWVYELIKDAVDTFFEVDREDAADVEAYEEFQRALSDGEKRAANDL